MLFPKPYSFSLYDNNQYTVQDTVHCIDTQQSSLSVPSTGSLTQFHSCQTSRVVSGGSKATQHHLAVGLSDGQQDVSFRLRVAVYAPHIVMVGDCGQQVSNCAL